jgi:ribose transport system permease protein
MGRPLPEPRSSATGVAEGSPPAIVSDRYDVSYGSYAQRPPIRLSRKELVSLWAAHYWTGAVLAILIVVFGLVSRGFLTRVDFVSTTVYASSIVPFAIAEMLVMLTGGIDLSVAGISAVAAMSAALVLEGAGGANSASAAVLAALVCIGVGLVIGLFNGLLVASLRLPPFIVTLGTLEALSGIVNLLNGGLSVEVNSSPLGNFGSTLIGSWIAPVVLVSVTLLAVTAVVLARTQFGLRTYAIGSNAEAVRRLGLPTRHIITTLYGCSGCLAGVSGLFLIARFGEATTSVDTSTELTAIAAVVIGGTSLFGGTGTVLGTTIGVGIISVLLPGLVLSGLQDFWQQVVTGLIIIVAILVNVLRDRSFAQVLKSLRALLLPQHATNPREPPFVMENPAGPESTGRVVRQ